MKQKYLDCETYEAFIFINNCRILTYNKISKNNLHTANTTYSKNIRFDILILEIFRVIFLSKNYLQTFLFRLAEVTLFCHWASSIFIVVCVCCGLLI